MAKTLSDILKTGMKIRVGEQDEYCEVVKLDAPNNQAWVQFGRSNGHKGAWNNISNVCNDFLQLLDTGVAKELVDIGRGKAFILSKNEITENNLDIKSGLGFSYMGDAWTATESSGEEAYYCSMTPKTFEVDKKAKVHLICPTIVLPADLEVVYCADYYYRLACRTDVGGNSITTVDMPTAVGNSFKYNGNPQMPELSYDEKNVTVVLPVGYTNVGRYMGIFRLKDKEKTQWSGGGNGDISFVWEITGTPITTGEISQKGSLTFNWKEQTPKWKNYDPDKMTISGCTSATNAENYIAIFTPKPGYTWSNGSTKAIEITWTIHKKPIPPPTPSWTYREYNGERQIPEFDFHGEGDAYVSAKVYSPDGQFVCDIDVPKGHS